MNLVINGEARVVEISDPPTILRLLEVIGLGGRPVLVERNGEALFPKEFAATTVTEGDVLEVVRMVAGG